MTNSPLTSNTSVRYRAGAAITLDPSTYGTIMFIAVTETVGGIRDDDKREETFEGESGEGGTAQVYNTYNVQIKVDGTVVKDRGRIQVGGNVLTPGADGTYTLITTSNEVKDILIGGVKVGVTTAIAEGTTESNTVIEYTTLRVKVTGKTPESVVLQGENAPGLIDNGDGTYTVERLVNDAPTTAFTVWVDGENVNKTASFGNTTEVVYRTITVDLNPEGIDSSDITSVELRDKNGNSLFMEKGEDGKYTYTKLEDEADDETEYDIYVNGEKTGQKVSFKEDGASGSNPVNITFTRYTTTVKTYLNGELFDKGTVRFGDTLMVRNAKGCFELTTKDSITTDLYVDGVKVRSEQCSGSDIRVDYYTITYALSGESDKEAGNLPLDKTYYLSSSEVTMLAADDITNGDMTFVGWKIGDTVYAAGDKVIITEAITATAVWEKTSFATTAEKFEISLSRDTFTYNGASQIPDIIVTRGDKQLEKGADYLVSYTNTNTDAGRGANNTTNAGIVTITVTGVGDYDGTLTKTYTILPKTIQVQGSEAVDRVYDGTTTVDISAENAVLVGLEGSDVVNLLPQSVGNVYSPNAGVDKYVIVGEAQIKVDPSTAASNYIVESAEDLLVTIERTPLSTSMLTVEDVVYNAQEQTPEVVAIDNTTIDSEIVNLIEGSDYALTYENNLHAGTATIKINAELTEEVDEDVVRYTSNYSGEVAITFEIAKADITITASGATSPYGAEVADVGSNYTVTGLYQADAEALAIKAVTSVQKGYKVGTYEGAVTISYNEENTDYNIKVVPADYVVTAADDMNVTASGYAGVYDGNAHGITVIPSGYQSGEEFTVYYSKTELTAENYTTGSTTPVTFTDAGVYTVYYYVASSNYDGKAGHQTVTIEKAPLTVKPSDKTIIYGDDLSALAASTLTEDKGLILTGLVGDDVARDILANVSYTSLNYRQYNDVGTYTVVPAFENATTDDVLKNYAITYVSGKLTVVPKQVSFVWPTQKTYVYTGNTIGFYADIEGLVNNDNVHVFIDEYTGEVQAVYPKEYNGSGTAMFLEADATASEYSVTALSLGGAKSHNYTIDSSNATWSITLEQAVNVWISEPSIENWVVGATASMHKVTASVDASKLVADDSIEVSAYELNTGMTPVVTNTATDAGTYRAKAIEFTGKNVSNYNITNTEITWKILKADSTEDAAKGNYFTVDPKISGWTYGDTPNTPVGAARFGEVVFKYATSEDGEYIETVPTNAGTYYMKAFVTGNVNYGDLVSTPVSFEIAPSKITIIANDINSNKGDALVDVSDKYVLSGHVVNGDNLGITLTTDAVATKAGEYTITVSHNAGSNYDVTTENGHYFVVQDLANVQIQAEGYTGIYDGSAVSPTLTGAGTKKVYYYVVVESGSGTNNEISVSGSKDIIIEKKEVKVTANDAQIVYGDAPINNGVVFEGFVGTDNAESLGLEPTYTINYNQFDNVGTYSIVPVLADTDNYTFTEISGELEVTKRPVNFIWMRNSFVYDGTTKAPTAVVKNLVNGDEVILVSTDYEVITGDSAGITVGDYTSKVISLSGEKAGNYMIAQDEVTATHNWTITKAANYFTVEPVIENWTYGQTASVPSAETLYGNSSDIIYMYSSSRNGAYTTEKPVEAGNYFVKAKMNETGNFTETESGPVAFQIKQAQITVIAPTIFARPGQAIPELTYSMIGSVASGDDLGIQLSVKYTENDLVNGYLAEGSYDIVVTIANPNENYQVTTVNGMYHVTDLPFDVVAKGTTTEYDGKYHGIKVSLEAENAADLAGVQVFYSTTELSHDTDFVNTSSLQTTSPTRKSAGTTTVYYYIVKSEENASPSVISGSCNITITKKELTVTANDVEIFEDKSLTNNGVEYEGFIPGENESYLSGTLSYEYSYTPGQPAGNYTITPYGLQSENYDISYVSGVFTVYPVQKDTVIDGVVAENAVYDGNGHCGFAGTPTAGNGSVTEFVYTYKNEAGVTIGVGLENAPVDAGHYKVVISVPEDNVSFMGEIEIPFEITKRPITVQAVNQAMLTTQTFKQATPNYIGFIGDANKGGIAIKTQPQIGVYASETSDTNLSLTALSEGTYALDVITLGKLTDEASQNYVLEKTVSGTLTVINVAGGSDSDDDTDDGTDDGTGDDTEDDVFGGETGGSVDLDENDPNGGIVQTAVIKDEDAPPAQLEAGLTVEKAEALLTEDELDDIGAGKNALVYLLWDVVEEDMAETEKEEIANKATTLDSTVGIFLDVSLYKVVGDNAPVKITDVKGTKVSITVKLPASLINTDETKDRTYTIIYMHDGEVNTAEAVFNEENGTLTFEAFEFSVYSIAYKDVAVDDDTDDGDDDDDDTDDGDDDDDDDKDVDDEDDKDVGDTDDVVDDDSKDDEKTDVIETEIVEDIPEEEEEELSEAVDEIKELDPEIKVGPFIYIPEVPGDIDDESEIEIIVEIPEDLDEDERFFYIITVDDEGNIIIIIPEVTEDGKLIFTGTPGTTYQIIYEDGEAHLANFIGENGCLVDANGNAITIGKNHCFWHYVILLVSIAGAVLMIVFKEKRKNQWMVFGVNTVLMILLANLGSCKWDVWFTLLGVVLMFLAILFVVKQERKELIYR